MENLFKINMRGLTLMMLVFSSLVSMAQKSNLFVYKFEGNPYIKVNDSTEEVSRGTLIDKKTKLIMGRNDIVHFINHDGEIFEIHQTGTFKHKDLIKLDPIKNEEAVVTKYIAYFWKEFTNKLSKGYNKSGVVIRGDYVKLLQPMDSISLYANEIQFEWEPKENKTKPYYFVLRENGTNKITKIGTKTNSITLFLDNVNLEFGKTYMWTVVESRYENLDSVDYSTFTILDKEEYEIKKAEITTLSKFLNEIGFKSDEIEDLICENYKTCL